MIEFQPARGTHCTGGRHDLTPLRLRTCRVSRIFPQPPDLPGESCSCRWKVVHANLQPLIGSLP